MALGTSPIGSTPFGVGSPSSATVPPTVSASESTALYLDPSTGDYAIDPASGDLALMPRVRHQVVVALTTTRGSRTNAPTEGIDLPRKIGPSFGQRYRNSVRDALRPVIAAGDLRLDEVSIPVQGSRAMPVVEFTDLTRAVKGLSDGT